MLCQQGLLLLLFGLAGSLSPALANSQSAFGRKEGSHTQLNSNSNFEGFIRKVLRQSRPDASVASTHPHRSHRRGHRRDRQHSHSHGRGRGRETAHARKRPTPHEQHKQRVPRVLIAIMSRATDSAAFRRGYRLQCNYSLPHRFFVGVPSPQQPGYVPPHAQGVIDPPSVVNASRALISEAERNGTDLVVLPMRDSYRNLPLKTLGALRYGYRKGYDYVVKVDDDYCVREARLLEHLTRPRKQAELYLGHYLWHGTEDARMTGADGQHSEYMSGWVWAISRGLLRSIAQRHYARSVLYPAYGSSSEDVDLGRWVQQSGLDVLKQEDTQIKVERKKMCPKPVRCQQCPVPCGAPADSQFGH